MVEQQTHKLLVVSSILTPGTNQFTMKIDKLGQFNKNKKLRSQILTAIGVAIFVYMLVATMEAVWQNYKINIEIDKLRKEIVLLEQKGQELKHLIAYRGTESFKEREARRKLGYRKPYEKVIAIPQPKFNNTEPGKASNSQDDEKIELPQSNPQKWWDYIFG